MKAKKGEHPFGDAGQLILFFLFIIVWVLDSFFLHKSTFLSEFIPLYIRLPIFCVLFIIALLLSKSVHTVLIHGHRPASYVVKTGAFKYIRHPLYLASILTYIGFSISTASLFSIALLAVIFIFHDYIASYEEKLLEKRFGDSYKEYKDKTGKWIPRIKDL